MIIHPLIAFQVGDLEPTGDFEADCAPESRLSTDLCLRVGGDQTMLHVHFVEVDDSGIAVNPSLREHVGLTAEISGCDPAELEQITIKDRHYIAVITPFRE